MRALIRFRREERFCSSSTAIRLGGPSVKYAAAEGSGTVGTTSTSPPPPRTIWPPEITSPLTVAPLRFSFPFRSITIPLITTPLPLVETLAPVVVTLKITFAAVRPPLSRMLALLSVMPALPVTLTTKEALAGPDRVRVMPLLRLITGTLITFLPTPPLIVTFELGLLRLGGVCVLGSLARFEEALVASVTA